MKREIVAVVPARSGSKRLPGKNLKLLAGKPLVFYTIDALLGHSEISKVIFTSDSQEYLTAVELTYGNHLEYVLRPAALGADTSKVHDEIVRLSENGSLGEGWFMLCLPTAPFRTYSHVQELLRLWSADQKPRFSACEYPFPVQFSFSIDDTGEWSPKFEDSPMLTGKTRSQDIAKLYRPNGALYLHKVSSLKKNKTFYIDAVPFLMSEQDSTDIDTPLDFIIAEQIWEYNHG